jgi:hypothetical protein
LQPSVTDRISLWIVQRPIRFNDQAMGHAKEFQPDQAAIAEEFSEASFGESRLAAHAAGLLARSL